MPVSWKRQPAAITTSESCAFMPCCETITGSTPPAHEEAKQPQRDVQHDPDVDPGVVGHAEPLGVHLLHVPPAAHPLVGVGRVEQRLEAPVPARGSTDLHLGEVHGRKGPTARERSPIGEVRLEA